MNTTFKKKKKSHSQKKSRNNGFNSSRRNNRSKRSNNKKASQLDHNLLINKAEDVGVSVPYTGRMINSLELPERLERNLLKKGFETLTEIQDKSLEDIRDGKDILGVANTGTGKTGAFLIPMIQELLEQEHGDNHALVIVPTRELALQVTEEFRSFSKNMPLYASCVIGGTNINRDVRNLRRKNHIIIGTPGRLVDLFKRQDLKLHKFKTLVLDEFDRMLDMGFSKDIDTLINAMTSKKQTLLFSATLDKSQQNRIDTIMHQPVYIKVNQGDKATDSVEQQLIHLESGEDKFIRLMNLISEEDCHKVIVFDETKHRVKRLSKKLNAAGVNSAQMRGDMSQSARQKALKSFKNGQSRVLVATDVAARGIDVDDISYVINYQVPRTYDSYIHRIGRTGRAGKLGKAFTFVD
jgi:ATP-dependent RNA helicase RhlE